MLLVAFLSDILLLFWPGVIALDLGLKTFFELFGLGVLYIYLFLTKEGIFYSLELRGLRDCLGGVWLTESSLVWIKSRWD